MSSTLRTWTSTSWGPIEPADAFPEGHLVQRHSEKPRKNFFAQSRASPRARPRGLRCTPAWLKSREKRPPASSRTPPSQPLAALLQDHRLFVLRGASARQPPAPRELLTQSRPRACPSRRLLQQYFFLARSALGAPLSSPPIPRDVLDRLPQLRPPPPGPGSRSSCSAHPFAARSSRGGGGPGSFVLPPGVNP